MRSLIHMSAHMLLLFGNDFILMDDNALPHRARIVEKYLEDHGLEPNGMASSISDLNPIEHLWDYLGRGCCFKSSSRSLHELKQGLSVSGHFIPVSDNNKQHGKSMPPMQVTGGHIPY
ncbi:DDE_3 domain-containing protein [Trichonephila clavipes]|nr:DDE_3 domain-containing protein [Trichonephila clavipes]